MNGTQKAKLPVPSIPSSLVTVERRNISEQGSTVAQEMKKLLNCEVSGWQTLRCVFRASGVMPFHCLKINHLFSAHLMKAKQSVMDSVFSKIRPEPFTGIICKISPTPPSQGQPPVRGVESPDISALSNVVLTCVTASATRFCDVLFSGAIPTHAQR